VNVPTFKPLGVIEVDSYHNELASSPAKFSSTTAHGKPMPLPAPLQIHKTQVTLLFSREGPGDITQVKPRTCLDITDTPSSSVDFEFEMSSNFAARRSYQETRLIL
jgi:hypothetical protein